MLEKTRLEELSSALPEKERKELLERIAQRMEREDSEEPIPVELAQDERTKIIAVEMKKAGWMVRLMLWMRTFFSGRPRREVFLEIKLSALKSRIKGLNPGLTGFETRDLSPRFARKLFDLYARVYPLAALYHALSTDKSLRAGAYSYLVDSRFEKSRKTVDEFITDAEMEEIYAATGDAEEIRKKLSLRLNEQVRTSPDTLFLQLEENVKLHASCAKLVLFPFQSLFRYFNYMLPEVLDPGYPVFEHAPAMLTLDLLEKLYVALALVRRLGPDYTYAEEPVAFYVAARAGFAPPSAAGKEPGPGEGQDPKVMQAELERVRSDVTELCKEVEAFSAAIPLLDLIRYFRKDPYYALMFNPPRTNLKSLYFTTLKARVGKELEERLGTIKERVIGRKTLEILKTQRLQELSFYKENPGFDFRKAGLPVFSHVRSITFVYNFLLSQYKGAIQEAVQVVANTALASNRITQNRLMQNVSGLEDLEAKIVLFDRSLSPDEEDGKQLARFRFNVATDLVLQKSYRAFVVQKDREARDLVDRARECLTGVRKIFDEIRTSTFENTRSLLKTLHVYRGKNQTIAQILNARSEGIGAFLKVLDQVLEVEKGA